MEISLEKIELVKDRTGVSYKEAKDALIKADGSVVDAIIMIEDEIDIAPKSKAGDQASQIVESIKKILKKGNVSRIVIKKNEEIILNIPVNLGIISIVCIPWATVIATIAALGVKCSIELIKDDGKIINISDKATETFSDVKENCSVIADDLREKGGDAFTQVKDKASDVINKSKNSDRDDYDEYYEDDEFYDDDDADLENDYEDEDYFNFDDFDDGALDSDDSEEVSGAVAEEEEFIADEDIEEEQVQSDSEIDSEGKDAEDISAEEDSGLKEADDKFEETIQDYKEKKGRFKFF